MPHTSSHRTLKTKAKNRVDDLQKLFSNLQYARKECHVSDVVVLEEQVHQLLREWKDELHEPSPATSLLAASLCSSELSSDMRRLLQLHEEEDDATSLLAVPLSPKNELDDQNFVSAIANVFQQDRLQEPGNPYEQAYVNVSKPEILISEPLVATIDSSLEQAVSVDEIFGDNNSCLFFNPDIPEELAPTFQEPIIGVSPSPAAFLGPKCALWDCPRPSQGTKWCQDYCSNFHEILALNEGPPGMAPVLRPGGIDLKDGVLFAALGAKMIGKAVGIPECEGAATSKSPWNAPELFDMAVLQGELVREWLFFDKPRRAFESGNRKQRSLPDYNGRGWHESRKQVMDHGGLKRSYYMDPQPSTQFEWHLYEYEVTHNDSCALYRLELKQVDFRKNIKGKLMEDAAPNLQNKGGRLSQKQSAEAKSNVKGRLKLTQKHTNSFFYSTASPDAPVNNNFALGSGLHYGYFGDEINGLYQVEKNEYF